MQFHFFQVAIVDKGPEHETQPPNDTSGAQERCFQFENFCLVIEHNGREVWDSHVCQEKPSHRPILRRKYEHKQIISYQLFCAM